MKNDPKEQIRLLVLQASPFCNINCRYCYLSEESRSSSIRMPLDIVKKAARFVSESGRLGDRLTILWHAGEPLAVPASYYEQAIRILEDVLKPKTKITYNFQTNATPINQQWCDFIKRHSISVGVSIDGPKHVHDRMRITRNGRGTYDSVMNGIRMLQKNKIPFGTISVISKYSLDHQNEVLQFLYSLGATSIGFNVEEVEGCNKRTTLEGCNNSVRNFAQRVFDYLDRKNELHLNREFFDILNVLAQGGSNTVPRRGENKAFSIVSVTTGGFASTFSPELCDTPVVGTDRFLFGHVAEPFVKFENNPRLKAVTEAIESGVRSCKKDCAYFDVCGGGAPSNKWQENGSFDSTETMHCQFHRQAFVDVLVSASETLNGDMRGAYGDKHIN